MKKEQKMYEKKCQCGKTLTVWVNLYDNSNSGMTTCDCGAVWFVN